MKIQEAIEKFEYLRRYRWNSYVYMTVKNDMFIIHSNIPDHEFTLHAMDIMADDWEEYIEPRKYLTHKEAMQALIDGKKLKKEWTDDTIYFLNSEGFTVKKDIYGEDSHSIIFYEKGFSIQDKFYEAE